MFFWVQSVLSIVFVVTGFLLWFPAVFSPTVLNTARLLHYAATLGGGLFLIVHVYPVSYTHLTLPTICSV